METIQPDAQEAEPTTRLSRSTIVHDQEADNAEMRKENEYLLMEIEDLRRRVPTDDELAFLRAKKEADDNAAWLWRMVKAYAPWVSVVASLIGSGLYWLATHTIVIGSKQ